MPVLIRVRGSLRSVGAALALAAFAVSVAWGAEPPLPDSLERLVAVALERHPEIAALDLDAEAARAGASASGRLMDPQWMLGAQALGAMPDSPDPTMFMVGFEQMLSLPGAYNASRQRAALDERWAQGELARVEADVKEALWEAAARLRAQTVQEHALDEQIAAAQAALAFGRARYSTGAGSPAAPAPGGSAEAEPSAVPPPPVARPTPSGGGMGGMGAAKPGMGGMSGGSGATQMSNGAMPGGGMTGGGMGAPMAAPMGGQGLAGLLRLDAEVARTQADRDALAARRAGEEARLALVVGEEAARAVAAEPERFLGAVGAVTEPSAQPERALAATSIDLANADVRVARSARLPTFMVATDVRIMPEGMVDGVDAAIGVTVPIWSGAHARVTAASASSEAASRRAEVVDRGLADAIAAARADEAAAEARARALSEVAAPRAHAAWEATMRVWAAGGGTTTDLVAAWQTEVAVTRDAVDADLAAELARARLARLEGR